MNDLQKQLSFLKNKKILITGNTGFKGSWMTYIVSNVTKNIYGISLKNNINKINHNKNNVIGLLKKQYFFDISNYNKLNKTINEIQPDFIFHLAAQSLVYKSYKEPLKTWNSNLIGTLNLLEILRHYKKSKNIIITSDKCYKNFELSRGYNENDILAGEDPYSATKSCAEIAIKSYIESFYDKSNYIVSCRAGNVIGGGDFSELRLIPDIVRSYFRNKKISIRSLSSTRPWQHVLEPLFAYLLVAKNIKKKQVNHQAFNFGPNQNNSKNVLSIINQIKKKWKIKIKKSRLKFKESKLLSLNCTKAKKILKWSPVLDFEDTVNLTIDWYDKFNKQPNEINKIMNHQINYYLSKKKW
jgi:CDP-glucose 4,6-dehydratase